MMKNIAVILRGHYRTFGYTHKVIFDFYDSIAENVEYYVSTWNTEGHPAYKFQTIFEENNKTPIKIIMVAVVPHHYDAWIGPSWLNYNIIPYKKMREREIKYDAVFDTRPDIIYQLKNNELLFPPEPMTLYTTKHIISDQTDEKIRVGVEDWFFMSSSEVHDIMNLRFIQKNAIGSHNKILEFANDFNINTVSMPCLDCSIVRPNAFTEISNPYDYFNFFKTNITENNIRNNWINLTKEEKINILYSNEIAPEDYNTASIAAKL